MLLAIDTSTKWISLALYDGAQVIGEDICQTKNHHTVELSPAIYVLLERCGVNSKQLKVLAVALGPGSFTSLRIGMAVVKGMSLALRLPVIGIPTLDILAASQPPSDKPLLAVLQAGRGRLAVCHYLFQDNSWQPQSEVSLTNVDEIISTLSVATIVCGELTSQERTTLESRCQKVQLASPAQCVRRPSYLAELGWERWKNGQTDDIDMIAPIYLHVAGSIPA